MLGCDGNNRFLFRTVLRVLALRALPVWYDGSNLHSEVVGITMKVSCYGL